MTASVRQRIADRIEGASRGEKAVGSYMLSNLNSLPFETAATLAVKVGVSEPTVGRFCRSLGYAHFKDLKAKLQTDFGERPWLIGDRLKDYRERSLRDDSELARSLELEIAAIVGNYELSHTPEFKRATQRMAHIETLFVVGFQTERGMAQFFANSLHYLRPGVRLVDLTDGNFSEILLSDPAKSAVLMIEGRRYSRLALRLASDAKAAGIATTLVTDPYCDWGQGLVSELLVVQTDLNQFWDSTSPFASLLALMINSIFNELGPSVEERMSKVSDLYSRFTGHVGDINSAQK